MLDQVTGMRVFAQVVASGSFSAAARALDLSPTMVAKHVDAIEARLGVALLRRSTRRLALTEAGRGYHEACGRILGEIAEAEGAASAGRAAPRGRLRLNLPVSFGTRQVTPLLPSFRERYPQVEVEFGLNDRVVDLVEEGWDLAVRIGVLPDSSLVSRRLAPCRMVVCASPAYLAEQGTPRTLADLARHECLGYTLSSRMGADSWAFGSDAGVRVAVSGSFRANSGDALRIAALSGLGIIYQPTFLVGDDLRRGDLVAIALEEPPATAGHVHVVFHPDRRLPLKARVMVDFLAEHLGAEPPWDL